MESGTKIRASELKGEIGMAAFSTASFLLVLRETIEAALIVSILLAYLDKTNNVRFKKDVWIGTIAAVIMSVLGAVLFTQFLGGFEGTTEKLFEGIVMVTAAGVLSWMIIWMMRNGRYLKQELQEKVDLAMTEEKKYALLSLAFISVFREGIETILFIGGVSSSEDPTGVLVSALFGALAAMGLAIGLFRGVVNLDLKKFFNVTSIILILFAAGLFAHGIHEFQELGWFGPEESFLNTPLFVIPLSDKEGVLGPLLRALFGYQDKPTPLEILAYVFYWVAIGFVYKKIQNQHLKREAMTAASA